MSSNSYEFHLSPQTVPHILTDNRHIHTAIPAPGTQELLERLNAVESRSMHGQLPIAWDRALDFNIFDKLGNKWIDFTSTIFVANVGHSNSKVLSAINEVLTKPLMSCYAYASETRANYLEKLIGFAGYPFSKAFLLSAGTEATEASFKLMRMYGQKHGKRRRGIICIEGNWHGRTMGAQMLSSNKSQSEWIGFQDNDIHYIPFPYPWSLNNSCPAEFLEHGLQVLTSRGIDLSQDICGFMLETFQGWGALFYPKEFVQSIESICRKYGILLAFDEMQSGFGRTGLPFGYQHYDVVPDLLACGKGMGGGVPISGVIGRAEIMDLPEIGNMSSTHSANPLVCAAGLAVISELEQRNLCQEAKRKGVILLDGLREIQQNYSDFIAHIFGEGLIASILFKDPQSGHPNSTLASRISELCMQKGLLVVHTGRESIKIGPPLTISDAALIEGINVLRESISELTSA
ncbi:aminotransferase class-III family protein [Synechococcus sp. A18-46.1]|nr:aminotransferase class-III family protein [Synechococcus sp. A18-46.1]